MNAQLARAARELTGSLRDYDSLLEMIGDAPFVLLGEATHGTHEFAPAERKRVRDALPGSYERLFHDSGIEQFLLPMRGNDAAVRALGEPRLERAIGVVYLPETERHSHYFRSLLPAQFDAVLHWAPETYPVGV
jgi:erythromycin esterase-like protein